MTHKLFILAYDGCQLLDVTGPAAVFGAANDAAEKPAYDLQIVSAEGGLVTTNCGVALQSQEDRRPARYVAGRRRLARAEGGDGA